MNLPVSLSLSKNKKSRTTGTLEMIFQIPFFQQMFVMVTIFYKHLGADTYHRVFFLAHLKHILTLFYFLNFLSLSCPTWIMIKADKDKHFSKIFIQVSIKFRLNIIVLHVVLSITIFLRSEFIQNRFVTAPQLCW